MNAVVVRTKKGVRRLDGSVFVLMTMLRYCRQNKAPIATRDFGPVTRVPW